MPQDIEKYVSFDVALLKGSATLDALWQDALKYHMIDHLEKLIAMRLTEYYEIKASGIASPMPGPTTAKPINNGVTREQPAIAHTPIFDDDELITHSFDGYSDNQIDTRYIESEMPLATSPDVALNAEAAADYWTIL